MHHLSGQLASPTVRPLVLFHTSKSLFSTRSKTPTLGSAAPACASGAEVASACRTLTRTRAQSPASSRIATARTETTSLDCHCALRPPDARMPPLRGTVMGDALGGDDGGVSTLQPGGFATWAPDRELDSYRPEMRGWVPKRGLPATAQTRSVNAGGGVSRQTMTSAAEDAARSERFFTRQKGERDSARKNARQPGQRRSSTQAATHLASRPLPDPRHDASVRSPSVPPSALSLPPPRRHRTAPAPSLRRPRATVTPPPRRHRATAPPPRHRCPTAPPLPRARARRRR